MIKIQFSSIIDGINAKKDKTLSIRLGTQEMTSDETSYIFDLMGKQVVIAIAETEIESIEIPEILPEMKGDKTPSQRLRGILYKLWEQKMDGIQIGSPAYQTFPRFYEDYIFRLCESLKDKIK